MLAQDVVKKFQGLARARGLKIKRELMKLPLSSFVTRRFLELEMGDKFILFPDSFQAPAALFIKIPTQTERSIYNAVKITDGRTYLVEEDDLVIEVI